MLGCFGVLGLLGLLEYVVWERSVGPSLFNPACWRTCGGPWCGLFQMGVHEIRLCRCSRFFFRLFGFRGPPWDGGARSIVGFSLCDLVGYFHCRSAFVDLHWWLWWLICVSYDSGLAHEVKQHGSELVNFVLLYLDCLLESVIVRCLAVTV